MASSYNETETQKLIEKYTANPCLEIVDKLAVEFNRPRKSIISKLVKEGVYITRGYRSKTGEVPVTKLQIVHAIEDCLDDKFPGLDKTPKQTLKKLGEAIRLQTITLEDALEELNNRGDVERVRQEMKL
jgi:hypothetical protein